MYGREECVAVRRRSQLHRYIVPDCLMKMGYDRSLHTLLTAKRKLHTTPQPFRALRRSQLTYCDARSLRQVALPARTARCATR
jgi:hypothetical protein